MFNEACAFGLPILTCDVGGVRTAVIHNVNGKLFPVNARAELFGEAILKLKDNPSLYSELCEGARRRFETLLNWDTAAVAMKKAIATRGLYHFS